MKERETKMLTVGDSLTAEKRITGEQSVFTTHLSLSTEFVFYKHQVIPV